MIKYVFFDIDDTLFPSSEFAELARKNAVKAMVRLGMQESEEKLYKKLLKIIEEKGSNYNKHFDELCKRLRIRKNARYVAAAVAAYHNTKASILPYPEVPRILLQLREQGYHLYVATEGTSVKQWDKLIRLGIALYFEEVFVSEEMGKEKGIPFFKKLFTHLRISPHSCVMMGDREDRDISPAKKAGLKTIRVRRGKHANVPSKADNVVRDLSRVPSIIKKL